MICFQAPLPDFEAMRSAMNNQLTPAEVRAFMRQRGVLPYAPSSPVVSLSDSGRSTGVLVNNWIE